MGLSTEGLCWRLFIAVLACMPLARADILLHVGGLVDVEAELVREQVTVRVQGERIAAIEDGFRKPTPADTVIDLRTQTVLPGLMDMHVHLGSEYSSKSRLHSFVQSEADIAIAATEHAKITLHAGFTVVRNPGDRHRVTVALRNAIQSKNRRWATHFYSRFIDRDDGGARRSHERLGRAFRG